MAIRKVLCIIKFTAILGPFSNGTDNYFITWRNSDVVTASYWIVTFFDNVTYIHVHV